MNHRYLFKAPDYYTYINFVYKLKMLYNVEISKLKIKYDKQLISYNESLYKKIINKKKKITIKYIKKILKNFPYLKNVDNIIFIHGSYSKGLNRWYSDIDFNILFMQETEEFKIMEELIVCSIYEIFDLPGRDKVHTMMLYLPMKYNVDYNILSNEYCIQFNDGNVYKYKCRNNYEDIYPKIMNSSRCFLDFSKYIIESRIDNEWVFSYEGLYLSDKKEIKKILNKKDNIIKNDKTLFFDFVKNYKKTLVYNDIKDMNTMGEFNKFIKMKNLNIIYTMLLILKEFIVINNGKCNNLNVKKIQKNIILKKYFSFKEINLFFKNIYKYIWFLDRIENLCVEFDINFSSRELESFDYLDFIEKYNIRYKSDFMIDYLVFKDLIDISKIILERIEVLYEK